jgi:dTDP-4-dehydrorhamnose 3,5-epimerase-like enzyme
MSLKGIKMGRIPNLQKLTYINPEEKIITVINDVKENEKTYLKKYNYLESNQKLVRIPSNFT